jgi:hypothetical protein
MISSFHQALLHAPVQPLHIAYMLGYFSRVKAAARCIIMLPLLVHRHMPTAYSVYARYAGVDERPVHCMFYVHVADMPVQAASCASAQVQPASMAPVTCIHTQYCHTQQQQQRRQQMMTLEANAGQLHWSSPVHLCEPPCHCDVGGVRHQLGGQVRLLAHQRVLLGGHHRGGAGAGRSATAGAEQLVRHVRHSHTGALCVCTSALPSL